MKNIYKLALLIICTTILLQGMVKGQTKIYEGPDDPAGDIAAARIGVMSGNRIYMPFHNNTMLGDWGGPLIYGAVWPKDEKGLNMHNDIALLIGGRVFVRNDSIPVTDPAEIASNNNLDTIYYLQTAYRDDLDKNPAGTIDWGFYPVFGYFNQNNEYPAMSNRPGSWPPDGWPARGSSTKWPGEWNGRFGRGVQYADLETYFVANDAQDQENLQSSNRLKYYPRPGIKIGDKNSGVTIQKGNPWGGLGLRVEVRGMQWNNQQTRDAIFFEYNIANISDYDLPDLAFGYFIDSNVGGLDDDLGYFDKKQDMAYTWDFDGVGAGGLTPGIMGFAFLESPGIPDDGTDNDDDGLIDEKRDNKASAIVGPYYGISDLQKFLDWYNLKESDLKPHWDADEDQDWTDGNDANGNGIYDNDEDPGDDIGLDGVAPGELNYNGPDADGTECNHKPDLLEGIGAEPNFGLTDISESDMLGLTMFKMFIFHSQDRHFYNDKIFYDMMTNNRLEEWLGTITNLAQVFASATFPLKKGRTERISMAELHSYEKLSGLNSAGHSAPALFQKKEIVQIIYESDYRFAQPPKLPTLKAAAGDGKVILTWDDVAEKYTREPLLKGANDFEGYKIYKATDKYFSDAEQLVDGFGNPIGKLPIFQCDLKDFIKGFTDFGAVNGELYYLGDDTGIQHFFVDNNVQNGRTYYYAIVAYDYGFKGLETGIAPAENNVVVDLDEAENVRFVGQNVQIVTPHQKAAGYIAPSVKMSNSDNLKGTGEIIPQLLDISGAEAGHTYKLKFGVKITGNLKGEKFRSPADMMYSDTSFTVYDVTNNDSIVYTESVDSYSAENFIDGGLRTDDYVTTDLFQGLQLKMMMPKNQFMVNSAKTGWVVGGAPIHVVPSSEDSKYLAWNYDIVFTGSDSVYSTKTNFAIGLKDQNNNLLKTNEVLLDQKFDFYVVNKSFTDSAGNYEKMDLLVDDVNKNGVYDRDIDYILVGPAVEVRDRVYFGGTIMAIDFHGISDKADMPKANDVYRIDFQRPFFSTDSVMFTVNPAVEVDNAEMKTDMDMIKVVPNPYVATNAMEPALSNPSLNQRRRILFTHVPAKSTIQIFTMSGVKINEIHVDNAPEKGAVEWDMLTNEGLEIAAGVYIYHVKSDVTGDEKMGKFAVIK